MRRLAHRRRRLRQCQLVPKDKELVRHTVLEHVRRHGGGAQCVGVQPPLVSERVRFAEDDGGGREAGVAVGCCERADPRVRNIVERAAVTGRGRRRAELR